MADPKRGISAEDLRPFSVADPLGERWASRAAAAPGAGPGPQGQEPKPRGFGIATLARMGCLVMLGLWVVSAVVSAASWLPGVVGTLWPRLEQVARELSRSAPVPPNPPPPNPPPPNPPASTPVEHAVVVARVCQRAIDCCLRVQGPSARALCENIGHVRAQGPCMEAYEIFAQVGEQTGRSCEGPRVAK